MRVKAGMRSKVAQGGRQADITNRAQMMMMMMTTGMSRTDFVSGSKYCNPYKVTNPDVLR